MIYWEPVRKIIARSVDTQNEKELIAGVMHGNCSIELTDEDIERIAALNLDVSYTLIEGIIRYKHIRLWIDSEAVN